MSVLLHDLQLVLSSGFLLVGVAACVDWIRAGEAARGYLALALGGLGAVSAISAVETLTHEMPVVSSALSLIFFVLSAYGLLLFRNQCVAYPRWVLRAATGIVIALGLATVAAAIVPNEGTAPLIVVVLMILVFWVAAITEPAARFWIVSNRVTAVQQARLRSLTVGYGGLLAIIVIDIATSRSSEGSVIQLVTTCLGIVIVPLLYVSFLPPLVLRRMWRAREEEAFREAVRPLLLYTPEREALAGEALNWAMRLIGAEGGFIAGPDGVIAAANLTEDAVAAMRKLEAPTSTTAIPLPESDGRRAVLVGLPLATGPAVLALLTGRLSPFFGKEELGRLEEYAASLTAALDRVALTDQLAQLAATDALTGLANRRTFEVRWQDEQSRARRYGNQLALVTADIDHFKRINDTFGHAAGDRVLTEVAAVLREGLRSEDLAARVGGEEFSLLLPHTDGAGALEVAQRLRAGVADRVELPDGAACTISVGIAAFPGVPLDELRDAADQALYEAKRKGRNRAIAATA